MLGVFFFNVILFDVVYLYADIFVLRCAPRKRISGYYSMLFIELDCYIHVLCFDNEDNNCFIPA